MIRTEPPLAAGERTMLLAFLRYQRETLLLKCDGLGPEQLRERAVPPSEMSLLGLVRHLARVEQMWLRAVMGDAPGTVPYWETVNGEPGEWDVDGADPAEALALLKDEWAATDRAVLEAPSLDATGERRGEVFTLRWVLCHLIEEYARHNGHADLLRERIDGATGE
ncbi:DinB family protein [Actinomadura parmotrematis]|uniref:DinB family protein n=1 Tax=Actinomadura parmotrematis TaxID=2864039 RepID=A0ABS7FN29_9ACTN|nr:DinB family protein [Actinomadura parmotrematis]MBW8481792.1 DinB family protein [Actinomadura parmotrematis]